MTENDNNPKRNSKDNQPPGKEFPGGRNPRNMFHWAILGLLAVMLITSLRNLEGPRETIDFSDFLGKVRSGKVKEVWIFDTYIKGELKDLEGQEVGSSKVFKVKIHPGIPSEGWINEVLDENDVKVHFESPNILVEILIGIIPWILIFAFMYFFVFRQFKAGGGGLLGNFGRSRHRVHSREQSKVTFEDVAGIDEAKDEVQEIIQFLKNPKKFQRLGGRIPRGVLLIGEPGCGKTLLAKAIAGEADVPFFSISGSDFVEMFVGVGASRVRDLFKQAKDNSPCIIFLDEIDAVGRKRGMGVAGGGHDEREQTLNAILVEMDGFSTNDQVIVIAATNRADVLDNALTRPGRFDRQVYVPLPDIKGRLEILRVHARKVKAGPDVDLKKLARGTSMFSGADLEAIINEAALSATMQEKDYIEMCDLEEARDKVRWGRAKRSRVIDEKDTTLTAFHEAGHALVQSLIKDADPVHKVSIIPRGNMGGATFSLPEKDRFYYSRKFCLSFIRICLGGRIAEELFCEDITSGAQSDIMQATGFARKMVMEWGMSDRLGFIHYGPDMAASGYPDFGLTKDFSEQTAQVIDSEVKVIIDQAYSDVRELLEKHTEVIRQLADALKKYETLDGEEVRLIIDGKTIDRPTVSDLLSREQQRLHEENKEDNSQTIEKTERSENKDSNYYDFDEEEEDEWLVDDDLDDLYDQDEKPKE